MVAAYNNCAAYIFDMETAKPVVNFEYTPDTGRYCVDDDSTLLFLCTVVSDVNVKALQEVKLSVRSCIYESVS